MTRKSWPFSLIQIQDEYIETLNAGIQRWSHRKGGGHTSRVATGARKTASRKLKRLGFTDQQISDILKDAKETASLIRAAEVDE